MPKVKVAVVQAAPVLFNREATVEKTCELIQKIAQDKIQLALFPEAFIPAYPRGLSFGMLVGSRNPAGRELWQRYWQNAVEIPGPATEAIGKAVRAAKLHLAVGVIERDTQFGGGTLYCTLLYFGPDGRIIGKHRKIKPTAAERCIWGEGNGSTLTVVETAIGKIGGLICWENYMPLARMAMYGKGVEIYLAPTADARDSWQSSLRHIACEGRCFVLGCNQFVTKAMYPAELQILDEMQSQPEIMCRGGSAIISPMGDVLAGPLYDEEGILLAEIDLADIVKAKLDFDVTGHYSRPDIFQLIVNEKQMEPIVNKTV
ncbi:MAG: carbon-nitrogen hydrolase family protein [Calditrichaeota bacterium]|nr:MAG: carbon-nitrogen hydrolase family protein [Calditrichota bacterium]